MIIIDNSNRGVLTDIIKYVKALKSDIILLLVSGTMIGTNESFSTMRIIDTDIKGYELLHESNMIKSYEAINIENSADIILRDELPSSQQFIGINDIMNVYLSIREIMHYGHPYRLEDINKDERFRLLYDIKADDGLKFIRLDLPDTSIMIPIFTGCIPIAKADTVNLDIYFSEHGYYLMYNIYKKKLKKCILSVFLCLDLK